MRRLALALFAFAPACAGAPPAPASPPAAPAPLAPAPAPSAAAAQPASWDVSSYRSAIDQGIDALLTEDPTLATRVGDHRFDDKLPDLTEEGQAKTAADFTARAQALRALAAAVPADASPADAGTDHPALDARLLADRLEAIAFDMSSFRPLERDPSAVLMTIGSSISGLTDHDFAPKRTRMDALATRLASIPALLEVARARSKRPSHAALENLAVVAKALGAMLRGPDVASWKQGLETEAALQARIAKGAEDAARAIDAYQVAVAKAFPLSSAKDEPIGAATWSNLARLYQGAPEPPAEIRAMGEKELSRLNAELDALIAQSGKPGETRAAFYARLEKDTPPPDGVLAEYKSAEKRVEAWMRERAVVTVPWEKATLVVVPTPPQKRGVSFASMNVAGPLEPSISDARLEVNEPQASMPADQRAALLRFNALTAIDLVTAHEGIPGHYLQSLYVRAAPSKVRKLTWASSFGEGWAHYCEQMAFENGYPADPVRMHAFYLRMALQRAARVVIDVAENDGSMSLADGGKFLERNAMLAPQAAKIEARRAVVWPAGMFVYTYGKLAILKMRDAVKAKEGESFDLRRFHDRLLAVGAVPVRVAGRLAFGLE